MALFFQKIGDPFSCIRWGRQLLKQSVILYSRVAISFEKKEYCCLSFKVSRNIAGSVLEVTNSMNLR